MSLETTSTEVARVAYYFNSRIGLLIECALVFIAFCVLFASFTSVVFLAGVFIAAYGCISVVKSKTLGQIGG